MGAVVGGRAGGRNSANITKHRLYGASRQCFYASHGYFTLRPLSVRPAQPISFSQDLTKPSWLHCGETSDCQLGEWF